MEPGPVEHFSLRWNNFQSTITAALSGLRDTQAFVDVTLWTEGRQIKAHRNVLSACSPVLMELLKDNPCAHPIVILRDVAHEDLAALVQYMYHGEVNVAPESLRTFLHTAQLLRVRGLADTHVHQEADGCLSGPQDSPLSAGCDSPQSPPKRRRPPPPEEAPLPLVLPLNGHCSGAATPEPPEPPEPPEQAGSPGTADRETERSHELSVAVDDMENGETMDVLPASTGVDPTLGLHSPALTMPGTPASGTGNDLLRRSRWCESCRKMIVRDFARHKREVHGESKPLPCDLCGSVFKYKRSLQVHVKRKHDISWEHYRQAIGGTGSAANEPQDLSRRPRGASPDTGRFRDDGAT